MDNVKNTWTNNRIQEYIDSLNKKYINYNIKPEYNYILIEKGSKEYERM